MQTYTGYNHSLHSCKLALDATSLTFFLTLVMIMSFHPRHTHVRDLWSRTVYKDTFYISQWGIIVLFWLLNASPEGGWIIHFIFGITTPLKLIFPYSAGFSTSMSRDGGSPLRQSVVPRLGQLQDPKSFSKLFPNGSIYSFQDDADETIDGCSIGNGELTTFINMPVDSAEIKGPPPSTASNGELSADSGTFWQLSKALSWSTIHGSFRGRHGFSTSADSLENIDQDINTGDVRGSSFHGTKTWDDWSDRVHRLRQTWDPLSRFDQNLDSISPRPKTRKLHDIIDIHIQKKKVQTSKKKLRSAFIELYRRLGKLRSYRFGNVIPT